MPTISLTVTAEEATRITDALAGTPYPQTAGGIKAWLKDYVRSHVREFERNKAAADAVAAVPAPADLTAT